MKFTTALAIAVAPLVITAPAWSQGSAQPSSVQISGDAVLKRIDALTQEIEQLKRQVMANEETANKASEEVRALAAKPVSLPVGQAAEQGLSRDAIAAIKASGEMSEEVALVRSAKAAMKFYGMVDVGVEAVNGTFASGGSVSTGRVSNGMVTPHFGILGSGNLMEGLQGSFNLEGSFAPDNGTSGIGGRLFGRQSWVALSGAFGTVRLGRQYTMARMGWEDANPYGTGNQGLRLLDPRISNPRSDNSISYLGKLGPVNFGVNVGTGWDAVNGNSANAGPANSAGANCAGEVPGDPNQCKEWSLGMKYNGGSWGIATSYEQLDGGTSATFGGLTSPSKTDSRTVLGGYLKLTNGAKLTAGWIKRDNQGSVTPLSDMYWVQSVVPFGSSYFFDSMLGSLKYQNSPNSALLLNLRGRYVVSQDTSLYVTAAFMDNKGTLALPATASTPAPTPVAGSQQKSIIAGVLYKF